MGPTLAPLAGATEPATAEPLPRPRAPARMMPPSQFQRFVQEATGRLLPVYGSELFELPQGYVPDTALPAPADYILGPGDEVRVQVWGSLGYNDSHTIDRNGQITLPKVGVFTLAGVPMRDLESVLRNQIGKVFTNFKVNANLGQLRSIQVYVVGQARQPGTYKLSSMSTLVNALFVSGGPTANGSMRNIQLKRAGQTVTTIDLYDFIAKGDKGRDLPLQAGDVIVIPLVGPRVAVTGALDQAAIYELKGGTTVGDILSLSGGVPVLASLLRALIERIDPTQSSPRTVQEIALNAQGLALPMRDGDVLTLLPISPAFSNAVTLQGTVAQPLRYPWFEGMRIGDLIPDHEALITPDYYKRKNLLVQNVEVTRKARDLLARQARDLLARKAQDLLARKAQDLPAASDMVANNVQGVDSNLVPETVRTSNPSEATLTEWVPSIVDQINWEYAVVERMDRSKLSTELIPFNLGKAVLHKDPAHSLLLQPGDVVTILSQNDLRLPQDRQIRLVRIEGEVVAPGVYQARAGETLPQLLQRIGGLTSHAYVFGIEFNRESVRMRQQEGLNILIRRLEAQSHAETSSLIANLGAERAAQAQLLQQRQQAQLNSQISRLKALKSNGRVALELDPQAQSLAALPLLPLEDGDHILVPATPGFVSAFGSINNENVFIYKPGKTVGDVIKSAGLTEDAEPSQAFVLRADGSIVARRNYGGFLGGSFDSLAMMPGDTLVVPTQIDRESNYNFVVRALKDWTQILANFGLTAAAIKSLRN